MAVLGWRKLAAAAACSALVAACGTNNGGNTDSASGDVVRPDSSATSPGSAPGTATASPGATPMAPGASGANLAVTGGDSEILQVLAVVDMGEVQDGQLAQRQARNAQVKAFARELVTAHTRALRQTRQLAKTNNVQLMSDSGSSTGSDTNRAATTAATPGAGMSGVAGQLHTMHAQMMEQVRSQQGAAFDSAFVNAQVMGHQQVLDLLQRAQGQAQNAGVQQHVAAAIKEVQGHLEKGQQLQQRLTRGSSAGDSATKSKTGADTGRRG